MLKQGRNTHKRARYIVQPGIPYESHQLERQTSNAALRKEQVGPEP